MTMDFTSFSFLFFYALTLYIVHRVHMKNDSHNNDRTIVQNELLYAIHIYIYIVSSHIHEKGSTLTAYGRVRFLSHTWILFFIDPQNAILPTYKIDTGHHRIHSDILW